jgi:nuclease S1
VLKRAVLLSLALLFVPSSSFNWGRTGHQVVANVAQERLSPAARKAVAALLEGATLASVSTEADAYRNTHPETERWHWVDIPITARHYDAARDCRRVRGEGDCILAEIDRLVATLKDRWRPDEERVQALKFVVHFVGDLQLSRSCPRQPRPGWQRHAGYVLRTACESALRLGLAAHLAGRVHRDVTD